jgi:hypothetical protein
VDVNTLIESRSTGYFIALAWMAALLPAPDELFGKSASMAPRTAAAADKVGGPSRAWLLSRGVVNVGEVAGTAVLADGATREGKRMFAPTAVLGDVEPADPMIAIRGDVGFNGRRHAQP